MNSLELEQILKPICGNFLGVFARDTIPTRLQYPCFFIANTDDASQPGEHWLAFYYHNVQCIEFFDSYGLGISFHNIKLPTVKYIKQNEFPVQQLFEATCGQHCVYFIYNRCNGKSFEDVINSYSLTNLEDNDYKAVDLLKQLQVQKYNNWRGCKTRYHVLRSYYGRNSTRKRI